MAEICVLAALQALASAAAGGGLASKASNFLGQQLSLVIGVHDKMDRIKSHLESIQSILRVADQKETYDPLVRDWVKKVRDVSYMVDDVLDNHIYGISDRGQRDGVFGNVVNRYKHKLRMLATYRTTAVELDRIRPFVDDIIHIYKTVICNTLSPLLQNDLGFQRSGRESSSSKQQYAALMANMFREDDLFFSMNERGITQKELVEKWIIEEPLESKNVSADLDPRWMVIAVWGMGGLGKTTLIYEIYHNPKLINNFDCFAWITVSKMYTVVEILQNMVKELEGDTKQGNFLTNAEKNPTPDIYAMNEEQLLRRVHHILHQKRYLIVFDDIWQHDFWSKLGFVFRKDHNRCSRILVTTRDEKVAMSLAVKDRVLLLEPLQEKEAWCLFCKKVFWQEPEQKCPPNLEYWAKQIAAKCGGLPLAIVSTAGMMSRKQRDIPTWERSYKILTSELGNSPELGILMHSYYDLPSYLKQCFLYCSIFPEDYMFEKELITRLWVAEGFLEERSSMTLEEVAEDSLNELIERSMIQVVERTESGEVKYCRIHDILRMIALRVCGELKLFAVFDEEQNPVGARRLSIHKAIQEIPSEFNLPSLRSLLLLSRGGLIGRFSLLNFKLLKVLILTSAPLGRTQDLLEEVFNLFNLRYFSFKNIRIEADVFPEKIERLQHLQTLDLWSTNVKQLPRNIAKLRKLRHLFLGDVTGHAFQTNAPIWELKNLQSLGFIKANDELVDHLEQMTMLRTFWITKVKHSHERSLCNSLKRMEHLLDFKMSVLEGETLNLEDLCPPPPRLKKLVLKGQLANIPKWFQSLSNLVRLYLINSNLKQADPLDHIRSLPSLVELWLNNAYEGSALTFTSDCFPSLKLLYIEALAGLKSIKIDTGALPVLRKLCIWRCALLEQPLPPVGNLEKLEELVLLHVAPEVVVGFQEMCRLHGYVKLKVIA